ncbi:zinc finger CCHC domain-containing protein 7-like [Megalops cyprinoides]|uniref:zinc finger CCHC domain-containing protein 7-like n=1 Tax=Megalops cyprinoides TaxID=118141 RepID=UPI001863B4DF|nr:zinc finger CCHC domain-containing protein 7-like [Megalops cyprinoides]
MLLDGEELEGDANIQLNLEFEASSSSAEDEDDAHNWTVSERDMEAEISSRGPTRRHANRYYTPNESVTCRNCGKAGHLPKNCPTPKKRLSCLLCGSSGHRQRTCPRIYCPNCGLPGHGYEACPDPSRLHKKCHRCGMPGHCHDACPDIWRQYHLTAQGRGGVEVCDSSAGRLSEYGGNSLIVAS